MRIRYLLLFYLYCAWRALHLAGPAANACIWLFYNNLALFLRINAHRADADTYLAIIAFLVVNHWLKRDFASPLRLLLMLKKLLKNG